MGTEVAEQIRYLEKDFDSESARGRMANDRSSSRHAILKHAPISLTLLVAISLAAAGCGRGKKDSPRFLNTVSASEFKEIVKTDSRLVGAYFEADWCAPCRILSPRLNTVASNHQAVARFVSIDVDDNTELADTLKIETLPHVFFFKDGMLVDQFIGLVPEKEIVSIVQKYSGVDDPESKALEPEESSVEPGSGQTGT
jgi:thioredoxin 1